MTESRLVSCSERTPPDVRCGGETDTHARCVPAEPSMADGPAASRPNSLFRADPEEPLDLQDADLAAVEPLFDGRPLSLRHGEEPS
ncbi:hypothetical protein [Streptomyces sp. NPDC003635]